VYHQYVLYIIPIDMSNVAMGYHLSPPSELFYHTTFYVYSLFIFTWNSLRDLGVVSFLFCRPYYTYSIHRETVYQYKYYGKETKLPFENQCKIVSSAFYSMALR